MALALTPQAPCAQPQLYLKSVTEPGVGADGAQVEVGGAMQHVADAYAGTEGVPITLMYAFRWGSVWGSVCAPACKVCVRSV